MPDKPCVIFPKVMDIAPYKPGTSKIANVEEPIKISSNENPFGASPKAVEAIKNAASKMHRYPDGACLELRKAIAKQHNINAENIVCGAGSDEIIALLCQAYASEGDEVIYSEFGFLMYPISAIRCGAVPMKVAETGLRTNIDNIINTVTDKTKIIFIANPNNPTGSYITKDEVRQIQAAIPPHVILVIDAAYAEYVSAEDYTSGLELVDKFENVVMTRTFSKIYGLGGLRIGWGYFSASVADVINRVRGPFNVSDIAQEAAIQSVKDIDFLKKSRLHNDKWQKILTDELSSLGLKIYPSVTNFILADFLGLEGKSVNDVDDFLKAKGIIARRMESYGLPTCMRFTIGLESENKALIQALQEFVDY